MRISRFIPGGALAAALLAAACGTDPQSTASPLAESRAGHDGGTGAVAVASNAADGNAVLVFPRDRHGALGAPTAFATGGTGTGAGLGNQGGLIHAYEGHFVLVVNAGSNDVSVFRRDGNSLDLVDRTPSGGTTPISLTARRGLVYVLNAGGDGNIAGFTLSDDGHLTALPGSIQPLSGPAPGPAQIGFAPGGRRLVVTEKGTNRLTLYDVGDGGVASGPHSQASAGQTPFGFSFDRRGHLIVSEASGGAPGASTVSSYRVGRDGLVGITAALPTTQTAACWVAVSPDGRFAYITNTGSSTLTGLRIHPRGRLSLLGENGLSGTTGATPIDLAFAAEGRELFTLNSGDHSISGFLVRANGQLVSVSTTSGLPEAANGMTAW